MAKVRVFKDRRKLKPAPPLTQNNDDDLADGVTTSEQRQAPNSAVEARTKEVMFESASLDALSAVTQAEIPAPPRGLAVRVPGVEKIMARVHARANQKPTHASVISTTPRDPWSFHRDLCRQRFDHVFHELMTGQASLKSTIEPCMSTCDTDIHYREVVPSSADMVNSAGYCGLEDLPILDKMMNNHEVDRIHRFFFPYNYTDCPAAVLLADPLVGPKRTAERNRNHWNDGHEAWLYVRKHGDVKWSRDWMAERGGMRQAVYLSSCEKGWRWEQVLGDLLDCRKSLNLWVKVKQQV